MNIKETFLKLTSKTYPHGHEDKLIELLPSDLKKDKFGNLYKQIGETTTMFASHLDTVGNESKPVKHKISKDGIISSDGTTILGADDKAGVTIMLYMIHNNVPGLYYFFIGEERGCIGSGKVANSLMDELEHIKKVISFDREGYDNIITHQMYHRTCSDAFAKDLAERFNEYGFWFAPDDSGISTDSKEFTDDVPECTNISVGYFNQHRQSEEQDIEFLEALANACVLVDWESLVVERDPSEYETKGAKYNNYSGGATTTPTTYNRNNTHTNTHTTTREVTSYTQFDEDEEVWEIYNEKGERIYEKPKPKMKVVKGNVTSNFTQVDEGYIKDGILYKIGENGNVIDIVDVIEEEYEEDSKKKF